ncbi:50S ribosomal protein L2 [Candidatus Kaiserbacteria bacterium CG10_big_fil_rev_8_21_14_0_10_45_20]|uniref:Large ribosomal subunit protein uL2 n=1 Tax=Candidatus Kaiserbacteria bacterium CG10_big_fil_rev_8_21_14_0_10_45_20 TaxID=1974607 RepID=A0A2H0UFL7_9BACT|nr:MAG: 50S ribosomal protein L2 [Candidatus Kaiserbacteria bacterium CG10_big_fil_rev_8_21_14_0_10_45_20]
MALKKRKPRTPGTRGMTSIMYRGVVTTNKPLKSLTKGKAARAGRNSFGRITTRHQGAGNKKKFRDIDFLFNKKDVPGRVEHIEYDPYRSGFIARVVYRDGERRYILAPQKLGVDDTVVTSVDAPLKPGNRRPLKNIPVGTFVFNVEIKENGGAKIARSAGNYAELSALDGGYALLKMPSGEIRKVVDGAWASIGEVSNPEYRLVNRGKAGRSRHLGIRPTVRGTAMNPVDHPHGGGEGRQGRGTKRAKTAWGKPSGKGQKTRAPKKYSNVFIVSRRKVGKRRKGN